MNPTVCVELRDAIFQRFYPLAGEVKDETVTNKKAPYGAKLLDKAMTP